MAATLALPVAIACILLLAARAAGLVPAANGASTGAAVACLALALAIAGTASGRIGGHVHLALLAVAVTGVLPTGLHHLRDLVPEAHRLLHPHETSSVVTASILLLVVAVWLLEHRPAQAAMREAAACSTIGIGSFLLLAYALNDIQQLLLADDARPRVASLVFSVILGIAVIAAAPRPDGIGGLFLGQGIAAVTVRWGVPAALLVPVAIEVARHRSTPAIGPPLADTMSVFVTVILLVILVALGARRLEQHGRELRYAREASFFSLLAHDVRTPLVAIRNLGEVVDRHWSEVTPEERRRAVRTMGEEASRVLHLIETGSRRARAQAGMRDATPIVTDLGEALAGAARGHGGRVSVECPPGIKVWVDPEHVRMMVHAAASASPGAAVRARVTADDDTAKVVFHHDSASGPAADEADTGLDAWTIVQIARMAGGDGSADAGDGPVVRLPRHPPAGPG